MLELIEISLWYIAVVICFLLTVMFLIQYIKRETISKPFFLGVAVFMVSYGIARLIENIRRYSIGSYNDIFDTWIKGDQIIGINFWLRFLYYLIAWIGIAVMYFNIERFIFKKNKFFLTICSVIEGTLSIINYFFFSQVTYWFSVGFFFIAGFFMPVLFLNLGRKSPAGSMRNGCLIIAMGMLLLISAVMIDLPEAAYFLYLLGQEVPEDFIRISAPIMLIVGSTVFSLGFRMFFAKE